MREGVTRPRRETRPPPGLDVHLVDLDDGRPLEQLLAAASPDERERAARCRSTLDRRRRLARRQHLRRIVGDRLGRPPETVQFAYGLHGKPYVEDAALGISLSHSGGLALYALGEGLEVGCDIERVDPGFCWRRDAGGADVLALSEKRTLESMPPERARAAFFRMWTFKEAALKCLGAGLSIPARSIVTTEEEEGEADAALSVARLAPTPGFAAAVAWTAWDPRYVR